MEFFFSGVKSRRELGFLQQAEVKNILLNPHDFRALEDSFSDTKLILDSLAYKLFKQGRHADYNGWRSQIDSIDTSKFFSIIAPDVIGEPDLTLENWRQARRDYPDLPLMPVFQWSASESALKEYLDASPVVGIGGLIPLMRAEDPTMLTELTELCERHPDRFHIFGLRWLKAFNAIKQLAHSADSSVWLAGARYRQLIFTHARNGHLLRTKADRLLNGSITPESLCVQNARNIQDHLTIPPMPTATASVKNSPILAPERQPSRDSANIAQLLIQIGVTAKDLRGSNYHHKIENPPYIPLSIEKQGDRLIFTHWIHWPAEDHPFAELVIDAEMIYRLRAGKLTLVETATRDPFTGGEARGCDRSFATLFSGNLLDQGFGNPTATATAADLEDGLPEPQASKTPFFDFDLQVDDQGRVILKDPRIPVPPKFVDSDQNLVVNWGFRQNELRLGEEKLIESLPEHYWVPVCWGDSAEDFSFDNVGYPTAVRAIEHHLVKYGRTILDETTIVKLPNVVEAVVVTAVLDAISDPDAAAFVVAAVSESINNPDSSPQAIHRREQSVARSLANRAMAILYWGQICNFSAEFEQWAFKEFESIYRTYNTIGQRWKTDGEVKVSLEPSTLDIENELFRATIVWKTERLLSLDQTWAIYTGSPLERPVGLETHPTLTQLVSLLFDFPYCSGGDADGGLPLEATQPNADPVPQAQYGAKICAAADEISTLLGEGHRIDSRRVATAMRRQFGRGSEGKWSIKDSHEAQEVALIKSVRANATSTKIELLRLLSNDKIVRSWLTTLQNFLPTHVGRTDESNEMQQFSTPLEFGYLAYLAANPQLTDILLEPSAGTGMLAALPSLVVNSMILNELSDRRADILRHLYGQEVFTFNAEQIHNYLPDDLVPTLTLINPPFSSSPNITSRRAGATLKHLRSAIKRTAPGGRIVLISAHWFHPDGEWHNTLVDIQAEATLLMSAPVPADIYRKHGTHMGTRISVFDKIPASDPTVFQQVRHEATLDELFTLVLSLPPRQAIATSVTATPTAEPDDEPDADAIATSLAATLPEPNDTADADAIAAESPPLKLLESETEFNAVKIEYSPQATRVGGELSEGIYETYVPQTIAIAGAKPHPSKLCESAAMSSVAPPMPTYRPRLPRSVIKNGVLSEAQIESIVYAGDAHSKFLKGHYRVDDDLLSKEAVSPNDPKARQFRRGFFLGDGTGCGKGRQIAGIIVDNWFQGRKRALWVSEKATLIEDAQRDWVALGGNPKDIISLSKFKQGAPITIGSGILFCTYATLRSESRQGKKSRLDQILEWMKPDFDGLIVFDECHAMGGAVKQKTERGQSAGSLQGQAGIKLQNAVPSARVVYVSATGATKVESLAYASRLGLWQTGDLPFRARHEFIGQISNSGVAAMEVMARDLKALGLYLARTLSYDGVEYDPLVVDLSDEQKGIYNAFADVFQIIHQDINKALEETGASLNSMAKAAARSAFEGAKLRFFDHLIVGLKTPTLIKAIERDLEEGYSCLVSLISTNEAIINRRLETVPVAEWNDLYIDVSPRDTIFDYLTRCFPVHAYEEYQDGDEIKSRLLLDDKGNPLLDKTAVAMRDALIERLAFLPPVPGALEQILFHFGEDNVAEVTGRSRRLLMNKEEGRIYAASRSSQRSNLLETQAFQDGKKRILVFSDAGGTGRSYHADLSALNQQRRICYMLQPGWRADRACQALGRAHRTSQRSAPVFRIVVCQDVPGEKRFVSTIAKRLFSLGALTRGQRQAAGENMFSARDDLENEYAYSALFNFLYLMSAGKFEECGPAEFEELTGLKLLNEDGSVNSGEIPMTRFMNRLLALRLDMQEILFKKLDQLIEFNIDEAVRTGHYEVGVETLRAKRFEIAEEQTIYTHAETKARTICLTVRQVDDVYYKKPQAVYAQWVQGQSANQMMVNDRSKRAAVAVRLASSMSPEGVPVGRVNLIKPMTESRMTLSELSESSWRKAKNKKEWMAAWNKEIETASGEVKYTFFLITGLLLPIWTSIADDKGSRFKVVRLRTDNGEVHLGRVVSSKGMAAMATTFGMRKVEISGADVFESVMQAGVGTELIAGLRLKRSTVRSEPRLELVGHLSKDLSDQVVALGCFKEIFGSIVRHFIPNNDEAPGIIEAVRSHLSGPKIEFEKPSYRVNGNQVHPAVLDVLERSKIISEKLYLPEQLERELYEAVNQALSSIGGHWDTGSRSHTFPNIDLRGMIEEIIDLGTLPDKNPLAYFASPPAVGQKAIAELELEDLDEGSLILEPSCGDGALLRALSPHAHGKFTVHAVELDQARARLAHAVGVAEFVTMMDFLALRPGRYCLRMAQRDDRVTFSHVTIPLYQRILMNPPFSGRGRRYLYVEHVNTAWDLLAPNGILVAILPTSIEYAETRRVAALRKLIKKYGSIIPLPEKSFHQSGTDVSTVLVRMKKPLRG